MSVEIVRKVEIEDQDQEVMTVAEEEIRKSV
jgi:hypothetical protein